MWRFGGKNSDFEWTDDGHFLGQHHARFYSQNETHLLISLFDNANGPFEPPENNDCSRGLLIALNTDAMTAQMVQHFDHPQRGFAKSRGSMQMLPNGNAFVGFAEHGFQSEHTPDGKCILEADMPSGLKTYRNYKFTWTGRPKQQPDVVSSAVEIDGGWIVTTAYVSWNGATEVASWNLYKTTKDGKFTELVASALRDGFETALIYQGYASYVMLEAIDREGNSLDMGKSYVVKTHEPHDLLAPDVVAEAQWLGAHSGMKGTNRIFTPTFVFLLFALGIAIGILAAACAYKFRHLWWRGAWWQRSHTYEQVPQINVWNEHEEQSWKSREEMHSS